jgi:ABC-2 type transport system ATP-binding protein
MGILETRDLTKEYIVGSFRRRTHPALVDLNLEVEEGEIFGLIGPNGAGKTTTLKLLMGLIYPTRGGATILGKPIDDLEMKRQIGYLPEHPYFYDYLTGRELLIYFGQLFRLSRAEQRKRAQELLEKVGMSEAADTPLRKYSKGMTQRLGIAQALVNRPKLVFFDEPMSGLDPMGRREMTHLVRELGDNGVTVFFCSHILPDVEQLCDRVGILNKGRLVEVGAVSEILDVSVREVEVVAENVSQALEDEIRGKSKALRRIGERCEISFADPERFERLLPVLIDGGARLVSVNRVKQTLEDHFVREISTAGVDG